MSESRIAKRYAKPLLELAEEQKTLDSVKKDMDMFASLCSENRSFLNMLKSPVIAHLKKAEILDKIFKGKVSDLTLSIFSIITRKNREDILPEVAQEFSKLYNDKMGIQTATITTATNLDKSLRGSFEKLVADISGKKALVTEKVDENLIGGFVVTMDDKQIDQSVRGALTELKLKFEKENS